MKIAFVVLHLLTCVALMCVIILQSGKNSGLSALSGAKSDTYLAKNKQKSRDARLALATKWVAGLFVVLTIVLNILPN
ncbi:MAG: preprotein translocase subunit SecG [Oscillospiraceae bacterium]|nr:preprotein translocase subunit SecG [Oscillospiraceae bacterium]